MTFFICFICICLLMFLTVNSISKTRKHLNKYHHRVEALKNATTVYAMMHHLNMNPSELEINFTKSEKLTKTQASGFTNTKWLYKVLDGTQTIELNSFGIPKKIFIRKIFNDPKGKNAHSWLNSQLWDVLQEKNPRKLRHVIEQHLNSEQMQFALKLKGEKDWGSFKLNSFDEFIAYCAIYRQGLLLHNYPLILSGSELMERSLKKNIKEMEIFRLVKEPFNQLFRDFWKSQLNKRFPKVTSLHEFKIEIERQN